MEDQREEDLLLDPEEFVCPIERAIFFDPVVCCDGFTYERCAIEGLLRTQSRPISPMTREPLSKSVPLIPNRKAKSEALEYRQKTFNQCLTLSKKYLQQGNNDKGNEFAIRAGELYFESETPLGTDFKTPKELWTALIPNESLAEAMPSEFETLQIPRKEIPKEELVVVLDGLPFRATPQEIKGFLKNSAQEVFVEKNSEGRPSGRAFAVVDNITVALSCNRTYLASRYVDVHKASSADLSPYRNAPPTNTNPRRERRLRPTRQNDATNTNNNDNDTTNEEMALPPSTEGAALPSDNDTNIDRNAPSNTPTGKVKLVGIPFRATKRELLSFVKENSGVDGRDVEIVFRSDGKADGSCFVTVDSEEVAQNVVRTCHKKHIGSRYVNVVIV